MKNNQGLEIWNIPDFMSGDSEDNDSDDDTKKKKSVTKENE